MIRFVLLALLLPISRSHAQGVTTAGIRGRVITDLGLPVDARVGVRHDATGFTVEVQASGGRFLIQGLEPGGPYTLTARALGRVPARRERIALSLGELSEIDVVLQRAAVRLETVPIVARGGPTEGRPHEAGTGTMIPESLIERLPTLNRDLYDFVRLVPQISTRIGLPNPGFSAGGMGFRYNNFLINGVSERTLSGGVSSAFAGSRAIPLDAVREYQVLLAPYDVRYGDFTGALVNASTKSGTNTFHGSAFAYGRTAQLARRGDGSINPYERLQYGLSLGGPIVRDRLHFFVASELQRYTYPAEGPYLGQRTDALRPMPVSASDLERFDAILKGYDLTAGSAGAIENRSPLRNLFTRLDVALPRWRSRLIAWNNASGSADASLSRASLDTFSLSTYQVERAARAWTSAVHLHTTLGRAGGGHNELLLSRASSDLNALGPVQQPIVRVWVPSTSGGGVSLNTGTHESAQGAGFRSAAFSVKDNLTLPIGMGHVFTLGAEMERFRVNRGIAAGSYGSWSFPSLEALALGIPDAYEVRVDFENADVPLTGAQYAAYAGDQWQATDRFSLTGGVRADLLAIHGRAPYQPAVDSIFGRRTDETPRRRVELSPRLGFVWDVSGKGHQRLRGGLGIFTGRYPLGWFHSALSSYGVGGVLRCNSLGAAIRFPPGFSPDYRSPPKACLGGASITPSSHGDVNLLDADLRMVRVARASVAYERRLPESILLTSEVLVTRSLSDIVIINLNLPDSQSVDPHGRVMYGAIGPTGAASLTPRSDFTEAIDLRNTRGNRSYQLSTRLETTDDTRLRGFVSYTYSRTRDVQTLLRVNTRGTGAWAVARTTSGRHDDLSAGISSNDTPHRVILAGTYTAPWTRAPTVLSFSYLGESGRPFTYTASGARGKGDLNADGSNVNDPIYVPRDAIDAAEILLSGFSDSAGADNSIAVQTNRERRQRNALEAFVERTPCLRRQRGRILERNSCREPWSNTTIASVRQAIPAGARGIEMQLDVFNVLNLLNASWGLRREAAPALLEHVGQTTDAAQASQPIFRFESREWTTSRTESAFQLQLALRYRF